MADLSDVESALVGLIAQALYPNGTHNPDGTPQPSTAGPFVRVYRGWPGSALAADLAAGIAHVTVFPQDNEQVVTRYGRDWQALATPTPLLIATAAGNAITLSGTPSSPLNVLAAVNGRNHVYPVQPGDTLEQIATGLASRIAVEFAATSSGPIITVPGAISLAARVGGVGTVYRELRRQKRGFLCTAWCKSPQLRDAVAAAVDGILAEIDFITLPDGTAGRLLYQRTLPKDGAEREGLYRRDLVYSVEYATTQVKNAPQLVALTLGLLDCDGNPMPPLPASAPALLLEGGGYLLLENGGRLSLESPSLSFAPALLLESGGALLLEGGGRLILEGASASSPTLLLETGGALLLESGARLILEAAPATLPGLLLESGARLLLENGGRIALEQTARSPALLLESGNALLLETGGRLTLEATAATKRLLLESGGGVLLENGNHLLLES